MTFFIFWFWFYFSCFIIIFLILYWHKKLWEFQKFRLYIYIYITYWSILFLLPTQFKPVSIGSLCPLLSFMINKDKREKRKKKTKKRKEPQSLMSTCPPAPRKPKPSINGKKSVAKWSYKSPTWFLQRGRITLPLWFALQDQEGLVSKSDLIIIICQEINFARGSTQ